MSNKFLVLLAERKKDYTRWEPVYCSVLREYVHFNRRGFSHLRFKTNNTPRNPKEAMYKLGLLPLVRSVIRMATGIERYERRLGPLGGTRKPILKEIEYWGLECLAGKQNVRIRVILRKIGNSGKIHFWSVMKLSGKNQKIPSERDEIN